MVQPVYIIDLAQETPDSPERVIPGEDAKAEAQPCGSADWVDLRNGPITLTWYTLEQCGREGCPHSGLEVFKKDNEQRVLKSGRIINMKVIAFHTHLIRVTGDYRITKADPWCRECHTWHAEGSHRAKVLT